MMQITLRNAEDPLGDLINRLNDEIRQVQGTIQPYQQKVAYNQEIIDRLTAASIKTGTNHFGPLLANLHEENAELFDRIAPDQRNLDAKQIRLSQLKEAAALTVKRPTNESAQ